MTALPPNLAAVADDLARATLRDARRSLRRRRRITFAVAFALLALTASAAIATGWLTDKTPASRAVPGVNGAAGEVASRTLLTGLGSGLRELSAVVTAGGGVCLTLTGFEPQCVPTFLARQPVTWFARPLAGGTALFGLARDEVTAIEAVAADGSATAAELANGAFYAEMRGGPPTRLSVHLSDGTTETVPVLTCPLSTPDCVP